MFKDRLPINHLNIRTDLVEATHALRCLQHPPQHLQCLRLSGERETPRSGRGGGGGPEALERLAIHAARMWRRGPGNRGQGQETLPHVRPARCDLVVGSLCHPNPFPNRCTSTVRPTLPNTAGPAARLASPPPHAPRYRHRLHHRLHLPRPCRWGGYKARDHLPPTPH